MLVVACFVAVLLDSWSETTGADVATCPDGWDYWADHCYYFSSAFKTLKDADIACSGIVVSPRQHPQSDGTRFPDELVSVKPSRLPKNVNSG
ncbi:hypothetical protein LSAT2_021360 [Lamellibrachia satsuma]|nr:hypothetical protein LSAT2_021360 [Lamellibrachia satsuma]